LGWAIAIEYGPIAVGISVAIITAVMTLGTQLNSCFNIAAVAAVNRGFQVGPADLRAAKYTEDAGRACGPEIAYHRFPSGVHLANARIRRAQRD
jgi:Flp pilus assembly pilin Flp